MQEIRRLNEIFPQWMAGGGIFSALQSLSVPWKDENIQIQLDLEYHGNISGQKITSPLLDSIGDDHANIASVIMAVYRTNWEKQWQTLNFEYSPIENYSMVEQMTDDKTVDDYGHTVTRTDNLTHAKTGTENETVDGTDTRTDDLTHGKTGTETHNITGTDKRTDDLTRGRTGTETHNITGTDKRTDNLTHGKVGTETGTPNITDTTTPNLTSDTSSIIHGFNSTEGVPTGKETQVSSGTSTNTHTGTEQTEYNLNETDTGTQETAKTGEDKLTLATSETNTGTQETVKSGSDTLTLDTSETNTGTQKTVSTGTTGHTYNLSDVDTGTQTTADSGSDTHTRNYLLTRKGNIGVTTSQQMIESERQLWIWNFFRNVVFPDVDRVLTIPIY